MRSGTYSSSRAERVQIPRSAPPGQTDQCGERSGMEKQTKLYAGNLPYSTTEAELEELFSQVGQVVEVTVIFDRDTGRSKGFGFVQMADEAAARAAVEKLNGTDLGGRTIRVAEARPRRPARDRGYSNW